METKLIALLISILSFAAYTIIIKLKYGVQKSISISYYCLPSNRQWLFILFMILSMAPLLITTMDEVLMPIAIWMVLLVGAAAKIELKKWIKQLHMFGAIGGIILGFVSLYFEYNMLYLIFAELAIIVALLLIKHTRIHLIWFIEISAYVILILGITISFFNI